MTPDSNVNNSHFLDCSEVQMRGWTAYAVERVTVRQKKTGQAIEAGSNQVAAPDLVDRSIEPVVSLGIGPMVWTDSRRSGLNR
jgi:hypothetical protein